VFELLCRTESGNKGVTLISIYDVYLRFDATRDIETTRLIPTPHRPSLSVLLCTLYTFQGGVRVDQGGKWVLN
jgi:hypothetical protein